MKAVTSISKPSVCTNVDIYFSENNQLIALPDWGIFFIKIGRWVAEEANQKYQHVIALSIPARNYAASLVALGVVLAKSANYSRNISNQAKFDKFCNLREGRRVAFCSNNEWIEACFDGVCREYQEPRIRIRVKSDTVTNRRNQQGKPDTTHFISKENINNVTLISNRNNVNNIPVNIAKPIVVNKFLSCCLKNNCGIHFYTKAQLDCHIIGNIKELEDEITKASFACRLSSNRFEKGTLQDVLRVRNFLSSDTYAYRTEIISSFSNTLPEVSKKPFVSIFDGALGFTKWRDDYPNCHQIVLLERTEKRFNDAATIINSEYINRINTETIQNFPLPPIGVEITVYQRA
ncbi:hypothetical protein CAL7716_057960 [Calothrix sp. PCC 7716]|nr:hypothetical protein CAL7716_057960 [Calothrix sp. PCC 7716]